MGSFWRLPRLPRAGSSPHPGRSGYRIARALAGAPGRAGCAVLGLEAGGLEIGADPRTVEEVVRGVTDRFHGPVIAKLTPNVTSIAEIARASEGGGATAVSAINTFSGMVVDVHARKPVSGTTTGGISGPAIRPMAVNRRLTSSIGSPGALNP